MAFHEEELNKRRALRQELQQQRQAQQRKWVILLSIAAVIVLLCGVWFVASSLSAGENTEPSDSATTQPTQTQPSTTAPTESTGESTEPTQETTSPTTQETTPTTTAPQEPTTVIHFAAAGDVNVTDKIINAAGSEQDYAYIFRDLLPVLAQADLTAVNFEGNLIGAPYGSEHLSAPQNLMTALKNAGVDLVQMANSMSIYNGINGLGTTLSGIEAAGMEAVGAWATNADFRESGGYTIREVEGIKVAVVAFTKGMSGMALPAGSEDCVNVLYTDYATTYQSVDTEGITAILRAVAEETPDITVALVHWGSEYYDQISSSQETIRDLMLAQGVDAIIGTHSHYVQAMEFDEQNGTFVAYSLGDLLSDGETAGTQYSVIVDLEITKDNETGETKITGYDYTPVYNLRSEENSIELVRLREMIAAYESNYIYRVSQDIYEDMVYALRRAEARVEG